MANPNDPNALPEFEQLRQQQRQKFLAQKQDANDAISRRFAAMGNLNSGAAIKTQQITNQQIDEQANQADQAIGFQQAQQRTQLNEAQKGRDFQSAEAQKARDQDLSFKDKVFAFEKDSKLKQLDLAERQFALDKDAQEFEKRLAEMEAGRKPPGLFDSIGIGNLGFQGAAGNAGRAIETIFPVHAIANAPIIKNLPKINLPKIKF